MHAVLFIAVLVATCALGALLQSLAPLAGAWALGIRDARIPQLARTAWRRSFDWYGWLIVPAITATTLTLGVPFPVWGYGKPLIMQSPATKHERRDWLLLQLSVIPTLILTAILFSMPMTLLRAVDPSSAVLPYLATAIKQLLLLALLQLVPVPPFAMGRAFPYWWHDHRFTQIVQGMVLAILVLDAAFGRGAIAWALGGAADLLTALLLVLS